MGFGGVSGMITSLKNNKRDRKSTFDTLEKYQDGYTSNLYFEKTASKKQLRQIREKLQKENRIFLIKTIIMISIAFIGILLCIISL